MGNKFKYVTSYLDTPSRVYGALDKRSLVKVTFDAQPYYTYNLQKGRKEEIMTESMRPFPLWLTNFPVELATTLRRRR